MTAIAQTTYYEVAVQSEFDVVVMRQRVREIARTIGLTLTQQAKLSAAISALARALINHSHRVCFVVRAPGADGQSALEIVCATPVTAAQDPGALEQTANIDEIRRLLDQAELSRTDSDMILTLRIGSHHPAH